MCLNRLISDENTDSRSRFIAEKTERFMSQFIPRPALKIPSYPTMMLGLWIQLIIGSKKSVLRSVPTRQGVARPNSIRILFNN